MEHPAYASPGRAASPAPKVCLLGGGFETGNLGVNALTGSAIMLLNRRCPEAELFLLDYAREPKTYSVPVGEGVARVGTLALRFSKKLYLKNNVFLLFGFALLARCVPCARARRKLLGLSPPLKQLLEMDLVLSLAAGDSFSDLYGWRQFLYAWLPQALAILLGKEVVHLPQTIGPFRGTWTRLAARWVLRRARVIYARDRASLARVKALAGDRAGQVRFCYDLGFALEPRKAPASALNWLADAKAGGELIGFNVSGLLYANGQGYRFGLRADYRDTVRAILEFLIAKGGGTIVLIPHVFGAGGESDERACREVWDGLEVKHKARVRFPELTRDHQELKHVIGQCDVFIGSRMHACIAALSQGVPAVSLAYSDKFLGVMASLELDEVVADLRAATREQVLECVGHALEHREALRRRLAGRMSEVHRAIDEVFEGLLPKDRSRHGCCWQ